MKKIVCLGAGSIYFTRALGDIIVNKDLIGSEIVLYDIDKEKADVMASLGKRFIRQTKANFKIRVTDKLADAVDGADFAISSIGGSGAEVTKDVYGSYYHSADIYIPAKYGIQQVIGDTCGPAGMMMGLRSVPAYLKICKEMEKRCPNVIFFNHSNPMAVICRAMSKYTKIKFYGVCHGVQGGLNKIATILNLPIEKLHFSWIGTNHYYWLTEVNYKGKDMYPELMKKMKPEKGSIMSTKLSQIYGYRIVYPSDDHIIEFYPFLSQIHKQSELPYGLVDSIGQHGGYDTSKPMAMKEKPTRTLRSEFFKKYNQIINETKLPKKVSNYICGEGLSELIGAIITGKRHVSIINLQNNGLIPNLPSTAIIEAEVVTDYKGVKGIQSMECPMLLKGILEKRFVWQELVADAAVKCDKSLALQALLIDEMAILPEKAERMLDELLYASKDLLPKYK